MVGTIRTLQDEVNDHLTLMNEQCWLEGRLDINRIRDYQSRILKYSKEGFDVDVHQHVSQLYFKIYYQKEQPGKKGL